ncbi:hypothetical protein [Hugenholtzia roseola]|uniref:hypothetical protein n=1 Tax=Hugenholtzia roseola TaxID=1002 RepID=UPI000478DCCE|nr:hypothetical protein [Hugenholtzia roseola]
MTKKIFLPLCLLFWLYAGMNRVSWAEWLRGVGVWNWVDTGLVALLFLGLNVLIGCILWWGEWRKVLWQLMGQAALLGGAILLLVANKISGLGFLVVYAEQLISLFFSPLLAFLFVMLYFIQKK